MGSDTSGQSSPISPSPAAGGELLGRIDDEWRHLVSSRRFRDQLDRWGAEDPRLRFADGEALVTEAQRRDVDDWHHRDRVLAALLERATDDPLAARIALQVVLPAIRSLVAGVGRWDVEERAARVVADALDVLDRCARVGAGTAPHFRVYSNTRRRVLRSATRERDEPVTPVAEVPELVDPALSDEVPVGDAAQLRELVEWVATQGGVGERAAQEVVLTRAGGVEVDELARILQISPKALRERRRRTEQRLQQSLGLGR